MALTQRPGVRAPAAPLPEPGWVATRAEALVPMPARLLARMVTDVPSWPLWDPGVAEVHHRDGPRGEPGMLCRLAVGGRRLFLPVVHMMVAASAETVVFAGGGRRWCFIEVVRLAPRDRSATHIERSLEIRLCGTPRWLAGPIRAYARRHLHRSIAALI